MVIPLLLAAVAAPLRADDDDNRRRRTTTLPAVNPIIEDTKRKAEEAYTAGDYAKVVPLMDSVLRSNPRDDVALYLRGSARIELGLSTGEAKLVRDGIADSRQAILYDTKQQPMYYLPYLYGMTNLANMENKPTHAEVSVQVANQALGKPMLTDEDRANLLYQRALAQQTLKKYDLAAKDYSASIEMQPSHLGSRVALAEVYVLAEKFPQAESAYNAAVEAFPNHALVYNNRGMFFQQRGKLNESLTDFTRALEEDPNYYHALTNRGYSLELMGNRSSAEQDYSQSLQKNPNQPQVVRMRAECRIAQGKATEAIGDYQLMLRMDPRNATARAELGFAQYFAGDPRAAATTFAQAVQSDASVRYVEPWRYLALTSAGQNDQAQSLLLQSQNKAVASRDWIDLLILYQAGKIERPELEDGYSNEAGMKAMQVCEAEFFTGQRVRADGNISAAEAHFRAAIATNLKHLSAFKGARFALKEFDKTASAAPEE